MATPVTAWVKAHQPTLAKAGHYTLLALAVLCAMAVAYSPHYNWQTGEHYRYPLHMDEYLHWGYAKAVGEQGTLDFINPFTGQAQPHDLVWSIHENGFWALLAGIQGVTGIDWLLIFEFGPALLTGLLSLAAYCIVQRENGGGIWAAGLVAAIPTSARFLGPSFLVPILFVMPFVLGALFLSFHYRGPWTLLAVFLLVSACWPIHLVGGFFATVAIILFAIFLAPVEWKWSIGLITICLLPLGGVWSFYQALSQQGFAPFAELPAYFQQFTFVPLFLFGLAALGVTVIASRRGAALSRLLTIIVILVACCIEFYIRHEQDRDGLRIYDRVVTVFMILLVLLGGIGLQAYLTGLRRATTLPGLPAALTAAILPVTLVLGASLLAATAANATALGVQGHVPDLLDDQTYADFEWIRENVGPEHTRGLVSGLNTMAFSAVTGKYSAYTVLPTSWDIPGTATKFYASGGEDLRILNSTGATIVHSKVPLSGDGLIQVHPRVYLVERGS